MNHKDRMFVARELMKIARELLASGKYIYDPDHERNPGNGFHPTPKGWSSNEEKENGKEESRKEVQPGREVQRSRSKHSAQRSDDFRRVQGASLSLADAEKEAYHSGSKRVDEGILGQLSGVFRRELGSQLDGNRDGFQLLVNPTTGKQKKYYSNVPGDLFHDIFQTCHSYLKSGDCVDVHEAKDYDNNRNFLSEDGLSGISITKDGDLVSVFNLSNEKGFLKTIAPIIKEKCKTLDCFKMLNSKNSLPQLYEKYLGFKTAAVLDFNYDFLASEKGKKYADHFVKTYGEAPVHFMVNSEKPVEVKHFSKDQWEEAYNYQQSFVHPKKKASRIANKILGYPCERPWSMPRCLAW